MSSPASSCQALSQSFNSYCNLYLLPTWSLLSVLHLPISWVDSGLLCAHPAIPHPALPKQLALLCPAFYLYVTCFLSCTLLGFTLIHYFPLFTLPYHCHALSHLPLIWPEAYCTKLTDLGKTEFYLIWLKRCKTSRRATLTEFLLRWILHHSIQRFLSRCC